MAGTNVDANKPQKAWKMQLITSLLQGSNLHNPCLKYPTHPTPCRGGHGVGGWVFEARIEQVAALTLVLRPGIRIPGRKSPNLDAWGGGGGVFEARIKEISAFE